MRRLVTAAESVAHIIEGTIKHGLHLTKLALPDQLRYEIERHQSIEPRVVQTYDHDVPSKYTWRCPDPDHRWHFSVDDQGHFEVPDDAYNAGRAHWRQFHEGRLVLCREPFAAKETTFECDQAIGHQGRHLQTSESDRYEYVAEGER